ncbi:MAG: autotransporter-associated beta strand repeat-containing protein, partial [Akkermansia sp.]|nr:autotransporter-associated beta strand repeat-containing protein [Akkermansia sp.]
KGEGTLTINTSNDYTGGTEIKGGTVLAGTATALGTGSVVLNGGTLEIGAIGLDNSICNTGTSTLQTSDRITHVLTGTISNTGTLTLSGSFDASALDYETNAIDERYALDGSVVGSDKSGFAVGVTYEVKVVDGGTSINDIATILHDSHAGSNALVLESDGYARANGDGSYSVFYLEGTDSLAVSTIAGVSSQHQEVLSKVIMDSGTLGVDQSITVDADGGSIIISKESELSGTIDNTAVSTGAGNYTGTISAVLGGRSSLAVGGGNIIVSGANSYTGGTSLNNGNLTITHAKALGTGSISAEGISSLSVGNGVTLVLDKVIGNTGTLTLSGSFDASALQLNKTEAGRLSLSGERVGLTESGFSQGVEYTVLIVDGGSTVNAGAGISHKDYLSRTQLVLGEDGVARAGAEVDYTHYFLTGGDSAEVSKIAEVSTRNQAELNGVTMDSGLLTVDQSVAVSATGGSIVLTEAAELSGTIDNTAVSTGAGDYSSTISAVMGGTSSLAVNGGEITVSGANSYTGGTVVNGGSLVAGNAQAFGTGDVVVNGAMLDLNQYSIA